MAQTIQKSKIVIVEGKDEESFFGNLLQHLSRSDIQIWPSEGKTKIRSTLKALTLASNYETVTGIAVIRDADDDPESAFQSVCDALINAGLAVPIKNTEFAGTRPRVGIMILPGQEQPGMLEDLCLASVADDSAIPCIDEYFDCLKAVLTPSTHAAKARMHAFLASRSEPDKRLGQTTWDWNHAAFETIRNFLTGL